ncbi:MAG: phosphatase PAP2 family protein [Chlorobiaceae bacterium]
MLFIEKVDVWLFQTLNLHLVHPIVDDFMVFLTSGKLSGHILWLAAIFIVLRRGKKGFLVIIFTLLAVAFADFVASGLLKPLVQRVRPCFALEHFRLLIIQVKSYSFASSHAANSAAVAVLTWIFFNKGAVIDKLFNLLMIMYALLIAYSRVYVGVHYPSDVISGSFIGCCSGLLVYLFFSWVMKNVVHLHFMRQEYLVG